MLEKILARFKGLFSRKPVCVCVRNHTSSKVLAEQVVEPDGVRKLVVSILDEQIADPSSSTGRLMRNKWGLNARK